MRRERMDSSGHRWRRPVPARVLPGAVVVISPDTQALADDWARMISDLSMAANKESARGEAARILSRVAVLVSERDALAAERDALMEALEDLLENVGGHGHWREGGSGGSCDTCERQSAASARARAALAALSSPVAEEEGQPYPPSEQLRILADATAHLLDRHDCDHHGHEVRRAALDAYRATAAAGGAE